MKYLILIATIASIACLVCGYILDVEYSEKLIGFGVAGLFFIVFPLFSYYRWKGKDLKNYMITKEGLEKMRESQKKRKH